MHSTDTTWKVYMLKIYNFYQFFSTEGIIL